MNHHGVSVHTTVVRTGSDRLLTDAPELIRDKRVGILTNHTGRLADGSHIVDAIAKAGIAKLVALYGPEHGITGDVPDGELVNHASHPRYEVPIYSLYGKTEKPTKEMLAGVDVMVCDIQDVGARFYTFISTVALALEAAAEQGIPFVLLDRPNPIRGVKYDGPIRTQPLKSFVGWMPIPVTHGMTLGELTRMWNDEGQLANGVRARLTIVPMEGWKRTMWFDETGLPWTSPSPNMPRLSTAIIYPGLCFVEGTTIAEGRGTPWPFELVGAPWVDPDKILDQLSRFATPGVDFTPMAFTPQAIPGIASEPKYEGTRCRGIRLCVLDRDRVEPVKLGIAVLAAFKRIYPDQTRLRHRRFDRLTGSSVVRKMLNENADPAEICRVWAAELDVFGKVREKYLMY
jgi:uncharacterized protein YbbC (DUF1343 family)